MRRLLAILALICCAATAHGFTPTQSLLLVNGKHAIPVPTGFNRWSPFFTIFRGANNAISTNFDITSQIPPITNTWFIDPLLGVDATAVVNDRTHPLLNGATCLAKANVDQCKVINLTNHFIARTTRGWNNTQPTRNLSFVIEGPWRFIAVDTASSVAPTWTLQSGSTYQTTIAAASSKTVVDFKYASRGFYQIAQGSGYAANDTVTLSNGAVLTVSGTGTGGTLTNWTVTTAPNTLLANWATLPVGLLSITATSGTGTGAAFKTAPVTIPPIYGQLVNVASIAAVNATPGSWFNDATNTYVQTLDSRNLVGDTNVQPLANTNNGRCPTSFTPFTLYIQGIDFVGGNTPLFCATTVSTNTGALALNNVSVQYSAIITSAGPNGLSAVGLLNVYSVNSLAAYSSSDGFNYHSFQQDGTTPGTSPSALEIGNFAMGNGATGSTGTSDNASTSHDFSNLIRVNGIYAQSDDAVVPDTNSAMSWNLGNIVGSSHTIAAVSVDMSALVTSKQWWDTLTLAPTANTQTNVDPGAFAFFTHMPLPTKANSGPLAGYATQ